jgi:ankyrin repeat protein
MTLDPNANPESIRKQAKRWLKSLRAGDADARTRLTAALPDAPAEPGLRHVQLALARMLGFAGWTALQEALADLALARKSDAELAEILLRSAWEGDPAAARRIFARRPEIARHSLHTAAMCGDRAEVEQRLARESGAAKGGPHDWEPLLYLAYGRIPGAEAEALAIAGLLLDHGGDPNARFDDGWGNAFTLITGTIGQGETDRPEHPHAEALAELLIARGADPFDTQTLYDTSLNRDETRWLDFLWDRSDPARWRDVASGLGGKFKLAAIDYLLGNAVGFGHPRRVAWLLDHGADANAIHAYSGRKLHLEALLHGRREIADLLVRHGAQAAALDPGQSFVAACTAGDLAEARRLAEAHPEFLRNPAALILAAQQGKAEVVTLLLELGADPDGAPHDGKRALHWAAQNGHVAVAEALIAAGSDVDRRGSPYDATPLGFANHFGQVAVMELLAPLSRDVFGLAVTANVERLAAVLAGDPALAGARNSRGEPLLFALPDDEAAAEEVARVLLAHGADPRATDSKGETPAHAAERRGLDEAAERIREAAGP